MTISFLDLKPQYEALKSSIDKRIHAVLDHGQFILGPEVEECELALAKYVGAKYALTCASGTDALLLPLLAFGIGPGDEVITTPFSFFATAEVISLLGATPVFVDIDPDTYNIDPMKIESAITPRTKAIMPVALFGQPADMTEINKIAEVYGLKVIEDAAQSFGAPYKDKRSGNLALVSGTSFFPAKPLGCYGDGGAVFTNDGDLYKQLAQLRVHGQGARYHHVAIGINGRLDTIQCAVLLEKLTRYEWEIERRNAIAARYTESFVRLSDRIKVPVVRSDRGSVWAQYTVMVADRDMFGSRLKEKGVPSSVHYPTPLHRQPVYRDRYKNLSLPNAEKAASEVISLPLYPDMPDATQGRIIDAVQDILGA